MYSRAYDILTAAYVMYKPEYGMYTPVHAILTPGNGLIKACNVRLNRRDQIIKLGNTISALCYSVGSDQKYIPRPASDLRVMLIFDLRSIPEPIAVVLRRIWFEESGLRQLWR